jgi:hypothetical protein
MKLAAIAAVLRARPQAIIRELKAGPTSGPISLNLKAEIAGAHTEKTSN